jgi:hypothetical protein
LIATMTALVAVAATRLASYGDGRTNGRTLRW